MRRNRPKLMQRPGIRDEAFTLVEMLVALTLTILLVAVTGEIAVTSLRNRNHVEQVVNDSQRSAYLIDLIAEDLSGLLPAPTDEPMIVVTGSPRPTLALVTRAAQFGEEETLHLARRPSLVRYRLQQPSATEDGQVLVREATDRTDPRKTTVRETVAVGLRSFAAEVLVEDEWINDYPPSGQDNGGLRAIRITFAWDDDGNDVTRLFVVSDVR